MYETWILQSTFISPLWRAPDSHATRFFLPGKSAKIDIMVGCNLEGAAVTTPPSGYMNMALFLLWLRFFSVSVPVSEKCQMSSRRHSSVAFKQNIVNLAKTNDDIPVVARAANIEPLNCISGSRQLVSGGISCRCAVYRSNRSQPKPNKASMSGPL